jgi:hypothetical protein
VGNDEEQPEKAARRRRAERLLGNLLPDQTRDESGDGWGERADSRDEELKREVPPHHGD